MDFIRMKSCAKINLSLDVLRRRKNGYHDIESLMQGVGMYDVVFISDDDDPQFVDIDSGVYATQEIWVEGVRVTFAINRLELVMGTDNLALKGIRALAPEFKKRGVEHTRYMSLIIDKRLPIAAGIAGGSGNAAVAMLGWNYIEGNPLSLRELMEIGAQVGADVPFSVMMNAAMNREELADLPGIEEASVAAMTSGIGDVVEPVESIHRHVIMVNPGVAVSTREVYEAIDALPKDAREPKGLWHNMMEGYTLEAYEEARELKAYLESLNAEHVLMSGSGPTVVAYYGTEETAEEDFIKLKDEICRKGRAWQMWLTETGKEL